MSATEKCPKCGGEPNLPVEALCFNYYERRIVQSRTTPQYALVESFTSRHICGVHQIGSLNSKLFEAKQ